MGGQYCPAHKDLQHRWSRIRGGAGQWPHLAAIHVFSGSGTFMEEIVQLQACVPPVGRPHRRCWSVQEDELMEKTVTKKLHWHIMTRFCLLTFLNHMDRANLVRSLLPVATPVCHH